MINFIKNILFLCLMLSSVSGYSQDCSKIKSKFKHAKLMYLKAAKLKKKISKQRSPSSEDKLIMATDLLYIDIKYKKYEALKDYYLKQIKSCY